MSPCVFVYCNALEKGFVTRLSPDQRVDLIYKQVDEVLLTGTDYELNDSVDPDLHFDAAVYLKAVTREKQMIDALSSFESVASPEVETPKQTEEKDNRADEDLLSESPEQAKPASGKKPPMSPQKKRAVKRGSNASSPKFNAKKTKTGSTQKRDNAIERVQDEKAKKHDRTVPVDAQDSHETTATQDTESPSSSNA